MQDEMFESQTPQPEEQLPLRERALEWTQSAWRPTGTLVAMVLTLAFAYFVINGRHGLSAWYQQRTQDKELRKEIDDLQQENAHLRNHIDRLKTDPHAIEHEARERLHYSRPGEVIYTLPAQPPPPQSQPAPSGK
jgi:cell division protein FtsB